MNLDEIRTQIDEIDEELIKLFCRRMDCSKLVAQYKLENNIPVFNSKREEDILNRVFVQGGEYGESTKLLYTAIIELSRTLQHDLLGSGAELRHTILNARTDIPFLSDSVRVACFGKVETYSHEAARRVFPNARPIFCGKFGSVFEAVENGDAEFGVIPIENSSAGSVTDVYDLMLRHRFYICTAVDIKINHCLAVLPGTELSEVRKVYSHPQALSQCSDFISSHNLSSVPCGSTALAATMVLHDAKPTHAAICSAAAAIDNGLEIRLRDFQNTPNNCTRFIVVSKDLSIPKDAEKISLCFSLPHVTGSLYSILCRFSAHGLNLTKIESRPIVGKSFEYLFYLDFSGSVHSASVLNLLCALSSELSEFSFLGNYKEI